jgi:hypothetical protein
MQPDFLALLDQMEDIIAGAPTLPLGGRIVISRGQLLDIIDAMYAAAMRHEQEPRPAPVASV